MPASNFIYDTSELKFLVKEWLDTEKLLACDEYKDYYSVDDLDMFLDVAYKVARDVAAPANEAADTVGAKLKDGNVYLPESVKEAYYTVVETGMGPSAFNYEEEGHIPRLFNACQNEIITSAAACLILYWVTGGSAADVISTYGDEALKARVLPNMFSGKWGGTMNLTEPGAGSDLGATSTKAFPTDTPGVYKIKGTKCFITSGDTDLWDNIIHLVLARIEGAREGTSGISLFAVPKNRFDDEGNITEWNDVATVGLEEKMGLHGSATCMLTYGENNDCYGWLIGDPPGEDGRAKGLSQMFLMMNESRLSTGLMALSVAEQAFYNAREYAKIRVQGRKVTDRKGPRVAIIEHEDVKQMLLHQKAVTEAMRALILKTYWYTDMALASSDPEIKKHCNDMYMINNPLCKAYASEMAWDLCGEAIQCYGGYGFIEEYPVAQLARDSKIYSIWEGTTFIQSMDLVGRKFNMDDGQPFQKWLGEIEQFVEQHKDDQNFAAEIQMLSKGYSSFRNILSLLKEKVEAKQFDYQALWANRVMFAMSIVYCGMLLLDQAILAQQKLDEGDTTFDPNFYHGKVASARFYAMNEVPKIFTIESTMKNADTSVIELKPEYLG